MHQNMPRRLAEPKIPEGALTLQDIEVLLKVCRLFGHEVAKNEE